MEKVIIYGPSMIDLVQHVIKLPQEGEEIEPVRSLQRISGSGYCMADFFRFLKMPYLLYTCTGTGVYGSTVRKMMNLQEFEYVSVRDDVAGCRYTLVDQDGYTAVFAVPGCEYGFLPQEEAEEGRYAILDGSYLYDEESESIPDILLSEHTEVMFCPNHAGVETDPVLFEALMKTGPMVHLSEEEAGLLGENDTPDLREIAEGISRKSGNAVIVLRTDGSGYYHAPGNAFTVPSFVHEIKDRSGMQEAHAAAFVLARSSGVDVRSAMQFAGECAALAAESDLAVIREKDYEYIRQLLIDAIMTESKGGRAEGPLS